MRICSAVGLYYSGSGAVLDLIKECDNVYVNDRFEVRFAYDPDGLSDLEYNLIDHPSRHNGSTAIKRFYRAMEKLDHVYFYKRYSKLVDPQFLKHTEEFLDKIVYCSFPGYYHYDVWEKGKIFYMANAAVKRLGIGRGTLLSKDEKNYYGIFDREKFYQHVKRYTNKVVNGYNRKREKIIFLDQIMPPSNFTRYENYFQNPRIVLVDRDPRDVYILGKVLIKGDIIPKNVEDFCKWYEWNRNICYKDGDLPEFVLKIQFEDLVYDYNETAKKILRHYGINRSNHRRKNTYFQKHISQGNTALWVKFPEYSADAALIGKRLAAYCYDFPTEVLEKGVSCHNVKKIF